MLVDLSGHDFEQAVETLTGNYNLPAAIVTPTKGPSSGVTLPLATTP